MPKKICFATNNQNKLKEIAALLTPTFEVAGLEEIGCFEELPETSDTLQGNSFEKADFVYKNYRVSCFADDTGLEVEALNGAPGVYTARYAGPDCIPEENIEKLLKELKGKSNRNAKFSTVITLILDGEKFFFEGEIQGTITEKPSGHEGFGYDPVFKPKGYDVTFSEMSMEEKNKISHRGIATQKLLDFLLKK